MHDVKEILVVEDNPQNLELVEYLLEEAGIAVRSAEDADQARVELAGSVPDLILMDMQLPGTDGLSLVREIRQRPEATTIPIIALTAHAMRGDRERFLSGGCDGYIAKPIDAIRFVDQIREILDQLDRRNSEGPGEP